MSVKALGRRELEDLLREFEDTWAEREGARVTSAEFYERYTRGEVDTLYAMAWASHFEIFLRLGDGGRPHADLVKSLIAS